MIFTKLLPKSIYLIALFIFSASVSAFAGGFPLRPGRLIISPSVSYFFANTKWDSVSHKVPFANNGQFTSYTYSLYAEYGLLRRFSVVASLPYSVNHYQQTNYSKSYSGLTDLETGIRYYLANINFKSYFTVQGTFITPLYTDLNLGYKENGAEFKLSYGLRGYLGGKSFYFNLEDGIRQYFGTGGPIQDRYNGSFGLTLDKDFKNQVSVGFSGFYSTSNNKQFSLLNPTNNKNFAFNQASLTYGHNFNKRVSLFLTGGHFITGRNTGDGLTGSASMIFIIDSR